ncbi:UDP-N-acetylglucosamine 2-epimerase [Clostridium botulinum 202F]|nr:UDP-N-acetylglucosamine 2-epimerase [Clostridium botulinum 202F]KAI3347569.1 UDP-N-acetylglucosamine 2-epimerase (non-hydrolyzing) [Clostridium botulinum]KON14328.1 UDP-N-acetylglucosamine 2-epimerase [Clostridium botulinum]MBY6986839.1 UDP-N-acetylglucosamine 2-epimerase (non-hydrolyzing) [Clostridium botulinum]NFG99256.1 UDP-N-acetylglucosamine 2-epimerase (non-hydrolyzing) [Clostridium botulinum]
MKVLTVIGARPQFIKAATVSNKIRKNGNSEILVHTGQHYDNNMSDIFFEELGIPKPDYNLNIGSSNHGNQTGSMLCALEDIYLKEKPDMVLVYGDTNSTLAGSLCASKLLIPVAHVEAGLRSFNKAMPEEQNRILTDHISDLLFAPTLTAVKNLATENIIKGVYNAGDVMYDAINLFKEKAKEISNITETLDLTPNSYILSTIHRAENTNSLERLTSIIKALSECNKKIILPLHPRTKKFISKYNLHVGDNIKIIDPVGYLEMISLQENSAKIVTDSGGVQKEAYFLKKPCITMRDETEWIETVENGWNVIVGSDSNKILNAIENFNPTGTPASAFGDGDTSSKITDIIQNYKK